MAPIDVHIKHAGKTYDIKLDPDLPPAVFKDTIFSITGVPTDRMKVMVKGGVLKDDSSWKKIGPKEGQTFMVIGAAGELPKAGKPIVFLEDMDESELAEAVAKPVGLTNLGNTCYMNATVQALRAVPELQVALSAPALQSPTPLPGALRDLYKTMNSTVDSITPSQFLGVLREVNPQFAEQDRTEKSALSAAMGRPQYAQQDAEECYSQIIQSLQNLPGLNEKGEMTGTSAQAAINHTRFVDQYFKGEMLRELTCKEDRDKPEAEREPTVHMSPEKISKIECNISSNTSFMLSGIMTSLDTELEKYSPSLGRQAIYHQKSRMSRLPTYLTVHMIRFAWKADISKKAKIMRQVKFPQEFDALDLTTAELKAKLLPASRRLMEIEKERAERRKVRKRTKNAPAAAGPSSTPAAPAAAASGDVEMADASAAAAPTSEDNKGKAVASEEDYADEVSFRKKEAAELSKLVHEDIKKDIGASATGLYELVAIITHKGAAADAGHYMGFVKKRVLDGYRKKKSTPAAPSTEEGAPLPTNTATADIDAREEDEDWYKFDDEKVTDFPVEKLTTLDGGGQDSSAYVLLYKSKSV